MPRAPSLLPALLRPFLLLLVLGAGCRRQDQSTDAFPRRETVLLGVAWGEPTSFNPLTPSPSWPTGGNQTALYEAFFYYNPLSGELMPQLATDYTVHPDRIEVNLNPSAAWNDRRPLTAHDVAFTYNRIYRISPGFPAWQHLSEVAVLDPESPRPVKLVFRLKKDRPNPLMVVHWLTLNVVLPQHVWEPLLAQVNGNFAELLKLKVDRNPVGSGPYRLLSYSAEKIVLERDDGYWGNAALHGGKLPAPRFIVAPIFKSNDHYSMALQQGRLDAANTFIPRIWLKARKGVRTWYDEAPYFAPGSIPTAFINHLRPPLDNVHFRRAMAFAINYDDIRELAVSGYSLPHEPGFILPFGYEGKYFSKEDALRYGTRFDPEAARAELARAGFTPVFRGEELVEVRDRAGARVPTLFIQCPTGWSDWESIVRIMVRGMRRVGIDVREQFVDTSAYYRALPIADFDLILSTPSSIPSPAEPWSRFDALLNSRDWAPPGDRMFGNFGRFNRPGSPGYLPRVDQLLERIPVVTDEAERSALYRELNRLCMELQPALPLVYRPKSFYEFNDRHWEGFPTAANPFLPPYVPAEGPGILTLWHLRPAAPR